MGKEKIFPPLYDIYSDVAKTCLALWPLFLVKLGFTILQYVSLVFCVILLFGAFLGKHGARILEGYDQPDSFDWSDIASDWVTLLTDPGWIAAAVGIVLLYLTWWFLLAAVCDGGVFRAFWNRAESGAELSLENFFKDGLRFLVPMIWLQCWLGLIGFGVLAALGLVAGLVTGLLALIDFNIVAVVLCSLFLGLPLLLLCVAFAFAFGAFGFICKAYLTRGMAAGDSVKAAYRKFIENRFRVGIGMVVAFLTYVAAAVGWDVATGVLALIPFIGFLFSLAGFLGGMALALFIALYLPALAVAYLAEN
jgi:hypothetical protein